MNKQFYSVADARNKAAEASHYDSSILDILRSKTWKLHRRLNNHEAMRCMAHNRLTQTSYDKIMLAFSAAYNVIETKLVLQETHMNMGSTPQYSLRAYALSRELQHTNASPFGFNLPSLPICENRYWGIRYVLDGSCHGASVLLPDLRKRELLQAPQLPYWTLLCGLHQQWPELKSKLVRVMGNTVAHEAVIAGARDTMTLFISALDHAFPFERKVDDRSENVITH